MLPESEIPVRPVGVRRPASDSVLEAGAMLEMIATLRVHMAELRVGHSERITEPSRRRVRRTGEWEA